MKFNFYAAGVVSSWVLTFSIIWADLFYPFKDVLKFTFTHHWIGKVILTSVVFLIFGLAYKKKKMFGENLEHVAWKSVTWSLKIIFLFYFLLFTYHLKLFS